MKKKLFWFPLLATIFSIGILYTIGGLFDISFLSSHIYRDPSDGVIFEVNGSLIPVIIGFLIGFITERILKNKYKNNSNLV